MEWRIVKIIVNHGWSEIQDTRGTVYSKYLQIGKEQLVVIRGARQLLAICYLAIVTISVYAGYNLVSSYICGYLSLMV